MLNIKQTCFIPKRANSDLYLYVGISKHAYFTNHTHPRTHTYIDLADPIDETFGPTALSNYVFTSFVDFAIVAQNKNSAWEINKLLL
jgi:hypothetical protein